MWRPNGCPKGGASVFVYEDTYRRRHERCYRRGHYSRPESVAEVDRRTREGSPSEASSPSTVDERNLRPA